MSSSQQLLQNVKIFDVIILILAVKADSRLWLQTERNCFSLFRTWSIGSRCAVLSHLL